MKFFRKIVIGVSAIVFTAIALTSTTYAWFKINSRASVTGFNFKLTGGLGFVVSIDGVNFKNDLTGDEVYMAMAAKYLENENYEIHYDETTKETGLYHYTVEDNGTKVYDNKITNIQDVTKKIELMPVTTSDGINMKDLIGADATTSSGRFIEFDVYFRTVSQTGYRRPKAYASDVTYYEFDTTLMTFVATAQQVDENNYMNYYVYNGEELLYDIYLNGDENWKDPATGRETSVSPTSFNSPAVPVRIDKKVNAVINGQRTEVQRGESLTVYTANALRMSIIDNNVYGHSTNEGDGVVVYELDDYENSSKNLGSYATKDYVDYCNANDIDITDQELMYDYTCNASYTYYSNLKKYDTLEESDLFNRMYSYGAIPSKVIHYTDLKRDSDGNYEDNKKITTLSSNDETPTRMTFKIWLEGWDADCFDGISGNIKALLSFVAVAK